MAAEEAKKAALHVIFFPFLAHGHMIPLFDVARLFVARDGVKATIITTPGNAAVFSKILNNTSLNIHLEIIPFPSKEVGLRSGIENLEYVTNDDHTMFLDGVRLLESPLEEVLERLRPRPSCIVSDMFLPWTADVAERFGVPRLSFHGSGYFPMSAMDALRQQKPFLGVQSEDEEFVLPGLPGVVTMTRRKMAAYWKQDPNTIDESKRAIMKMMEAAFEAEKRSFGVVMNSFEELEPDYAEHYRKVMGRRAWSIGPVSLCNRNIEDKAVRGKIAAIDEHECLRWLDSKPPNSVIYISFGSVTKMCAAQLREIALALDTLDHHFIWVIRHNEASEKDEGWLPSGFEERTQDKGLIIRGWAPQVMILDHKATSGFVTHCGWNSTLEGISAGVTMVTFPVFGEQFLNEKLITDVLKVGLSVGSKQYFDWVVEGVSVGREAVEKAVRRVMVGEEAEETRRKVEKLKEIAWKAVKEGGSSYEGLSDLLKEMRSFHAADEY